MIRRHGERPVGWARIVLFVAVATASAHAQTLQTVMVPMGDGVELATDVWLPPDGGATPRPVLLRRTPYGRALDADTVNGMISLGMIPVSQDVRGRGDSEGVFLPFFDDAEDGADTIAWAASQSWSNGRVGTFGGSAEGIVQLMAMGSGPPALRCAHVTVATDDVYEGMFPGGAWRTELTTRWLEGFPALDVLAAWRDHEALDAYWDPARLDGTERARVGIPVLLVGGFYDIFAVGTPRTHRKLQTGAAPAARTNQFLILGPWTHGGQSSAVQGEVAYDVHATYEDGITDMIAFFSWCLGSGARPAWPPVRYYVTRLGDSGTTGTGEWRTADAWPPPSTPLTLHFHDDGGLRRAMPLDTGAPQDLPVDPASPVPTRGGGNLTEPAGPFDQRTVDESESVLVACTGPALDPAEVIGDVTASIWAASATTDADVVVKLEQITPDGHSMLLADGIRRGRFLGGRDAIRPLVPGTPALFEVEVGPVAVTLPPGHALRVAIAGTNSPRYEPNPGTATPLGDDPTPVATTLTIFRDAEHPSAVVLPVAAGTVPDLPGGPGPTDDEDGGDADSDAGTDGDADALDDVVADDGAVDVPADAATDATADVPTPPSGSSGCTCAAAGADGRPAGIVAGIVLALGIVARRRFSALSARTRVR